MCWDGTQYEVAWEDYRSQYSGNSDIYYTTVSSSGVVSSDPQVGLVTDLIPDLKPRLFGLNGSGALFYSSYNNYVNCTMA